MLLQEATDPANILRVKIYSYLTSLDFDSKHIDGLVVPATRSRSSLVSGKFPGQERCGPDGGITVGKNPSYALQDPMISSTPGV